MARALVDQAAAVLLDFDGPVCAIFAGLPAADVADRLLAHLHAMAPSIALPEAEDDPLEILRWASKNAPELSGAAEHFLAASELDAASDASPTQGCSEFLGTMARDGRPVAIVSNNSAPAIASYLQQQRLDSLIVTIVGRDPLDASLMKPHPWPLLEALDRLGASAHECVMIGDSASDIVAAQRVNAPSIALANKPGKATAFHGLGARAVITSMLSIAGSPRST